MFAVLGFFGREVFVGIQHLFYGSYKPVGESQGIAYSSVDGMAAYVPQVQLIVVLWMYEDAADCVVIV